MQVTIYVPPDIGFRIRAGELDGQVSKICQAALRRRFAELDGAPPPVSPDDERDLEALAQEICMFLPADPEVHALAERRVKGVIARIFNLGRDIGGKEAREP